MTVLATGQKETIHLAAQHMLTVSASASGSGSIWRKDVSPPTLTTLAQNGAAYIGPFATSTVHEVIAVDDSLTTSTAPVDFPTSAEAAEQMVNWLPLYTVPISGTYAPGLVEMFGSGAPASSVQAYGNIDPTGDENSLTYTAVVYGSGGNDITIEYVDPEENDAELSVSVTASAITVSLATDESGDITTTAAQIKTAIEASEDASALVTVEIAGSDGGADDGSGVVTAVSAESLADGTGLGVDAAATGSRYTDITNGKLYMNTGTDTQPVWTQFLSTADL